MIAKRVLSLWLPVFAYAVLIFYFSCLPGRCVPQPFLFSDKFYHFIEYFPFGLLLFRAFYGTYAPLNKKTLVLILSLLALYGLSDEIHQLFVTDRVFSFADLFFDVLGGATGGLIYLWQK